MQDSDEFSSQNNSSFHDVSFSIPSSENTAEVNLEVAEAEMIRTPAIKEAGIADQTSSTSQNFQPPPSSLL